MRRRFGQTLRIGLAANGMALAKVRHWPRAQAELLAERTLPQGHEQLSRELGSLCDSENLAGRAVTVVLADELVRMWQVTPPPAASRPADLEAAAALRLQALFGASVTEWRISAAWDGKHPFLAAAVPLALLEQLQQAAREHRFDLVEIVPQFVASLNQWRKLRRQDAWFGQLHDGVLTIAAQDAGHLVAVRGVALPEVADRGWLERLVEREALRLGLARPDCLQVCGPAPSAWAGSSDGPNLICSLLGQADHGISALAQLALAGRAQ